MTESYPYEFAFTRALNARAGRAVGMRGMALRILFFFVCLALGAILGAASSSGVGILLTRRFWAQATSELWISMALCLIIPLLWPFLLQAWNWLSFSRQAFANQIMRGTVDAQGLKSETAGAQSFLAWTTMKSIEVRDGLLLMRLGPGRVLFIPADAFASPGDFAAAVALAQRAQAGRPGA
jgi:hypothetical protein